MPETGLDRNGAEETESSSNLLSDEAVTAQTRQLGREQMTE